MSDNIQDSGIWQRPSIQEDVPVKGWSGDVIGCIILLLFVLMPVFAIVSAVREGWPKGERVEIGAQHMLVQTTPNEWSESVDGPRVAGMMYFSCPVAVRFQYPGRTHCLLNVTSVMVDAGPRRFRIMKESKPTEVNGNDPNDPVEVTFRKF